MAEKQPEDTAEVKLLKLKLHFTEEILSNYKYLIGQLNYNAKDIERTIQSNRKEKSGEEIKKIELNSEQFTKLFEFLSCTESPFLISGNTDRYVREYVGKIQNAQEVLKRL